MYAINTILQSLNQDSLVRQELDDLADELATAEAAVRSSGDAVDTLPHKQGHYLVTVLTRAAAIHANPSSTPVRINCKQDPRAKAFFMGSSNHWQAVVNVRGTWTLRDETTVFPVRDLRNVFNDMPKRSGMVLMQHDPGGQEIIDANQSERARERAIEGSQTPLKPSLPSLHPKSCKA